MCRKTVCFTFFVLWTFELAGSNTTEVSTIRQTTESTTTSVPITTTSINSKQATRFNRDPCIPDPCRNGATCVTKKKKKLGSATTYSYVCKCLPSFTGVHCETGPEGDCDEYCPEAAQCTYASRSLGPRSKILADSTVHTFLDYVDEKFIIIIFLYDDSEFCFCPEGKYGADCQSPCPKGHYGPLCVGHCYTCKNEDCSPIDGQCNKGCVDGFTGSHCAKETVCLENSKTCRHGFCRDSPFGLEDVQIGRLKTWELLAENTMERKQMCVCNDGYHTAYCNKKCPKYKSISVQKFGMNCKQPQRPSCDRCKNPNKHCSVVTGQCKKCRKGYYLPYCQDASEILAQRQYVNDKITQVEPDRDDADILAKDDMVEVSVQVEYFTSTTTSAQTGEDLIPEVTELVEVRANLASLQKMLRQANNSVVDWEGEVQLLTAQVKRLKKEKEVLDYKLASARASERDVKEQLIASNNEQIELKSELARLTGETERYSIESSSLSLKLDDSIENLWNSEEALEAAARPVQDLVKEEGRLKRFFNRRRNLEGEMKTSAKEAVKEKFGLLKGKVGGRLDALKAKTQNLKNQLDRDKDKTTAQPTTEIPLLIELRKRRQASNQDEIRVEALMAIYVPSTITGQSDFKENFRDAVKDSADLFETEIIPGLKMDKDSVLLLRVPTPETTSKDDTVLRKTVIIYVIGGIVAVAVLTGLVWAVYKTARSSDSNRITFDRSTQHSRFQHMHVKGRPTHRNLKSSGPVHIQTSSDILSSVQSGVKGKARRLSENRNKSDQNRT